MKIFRYILLVLLLGNIPSFVLFNYDNSTGSLFSYITFIILIAYYFISSKYKPAWPFIIFAILYFTISGVVYVEDEKFYFIEFIKYLILIICGGELARNTSSKEVFFVLLIGVSSILINAILFSNDYGRYSGIYLDPNSAGFVCLLGFALSFSKENKKYKILGILFFTFCGLLTLSRTFIIIWLTLILFSILQNKKNIKILMIGIGAIVLLISFSMLLSLNEERFTIIENFMTNGINYQSINQGSRTETWSHYYKNILDKPFFGNGYLSFTGIKEVNAGVHNNYLRIIGESGIFPFIIFVGIYIYILFLSLKKFKAELYLTLLAISLITLHLTNHNFATINHVTFMSIWLYLILEKNEDDKNINLLKT